MKASAERAARRNPTQARVCHAGVWRRQPGVISGGHRAPLITLLMLCGAQTDRKTGRQVDDFHFLLKERAPREEEEEEAEEREEVCVCLLSHFPL